MGELIKTKTVTGPCPRNSGHLVTTHETPQCRINLQVHSQLGLLEEAEIPNPPYACLPAARLRRHSGGTRSMPKRLSGINLKNKTTSYFTSKTSLLGNSRGTASWDKLWQTTGKSKETRDVQLLLGFRENLGGLF